MFVLQKNKGFQLQFGNGWTASIMWGADNYGDNHKAAFDKPIEPSRTAEIAAFPTNTASPNENWLRFSNDTESPTYVKGWVTPEQVATFIALVATLPEHTDSSPTPTLLTL